MSRSRAPMPFACTGILVLALGAIAPMPAAAQLFGQPQPQTNVGELVVRLNQLEGQVRALNGQVEQLQFRNQQLEASLKRMQEDYEFRFQEMTGRGGQARPPAQRPPSAATPGQPPRRSDVFDPSQDPTAPGAPRSLGGGPGPVAGGPPPGVGGPLIVPGSEVPVGAPGGRESGQPLDLTTLASRAANDPTLAPPPARPDLSPPSPVGVRPQIGSAPVATAPQVGAAPVGAAPGPQAALPPASASARQDYDQAYSSILGRDYATAETGLRQFLANHPRDRLVPNATYWLGESLYQRQRFREAAEQFLKVSTDFPNAQVAPNSLLRLGQSLAALGEKDAACATLGEAGRKYPNAPQSVRQSLDQEQRRVRC